MRQKKSEWNVVDSTSQASFSPEKWQSTGNLKPQNKKKKINNFRLPGTMSSDF